MMELRLDLTVCFLIVLCTFAAVEPKWCSRTNSDVMQHEVTVTEKCNQTYQDSCSFFSWDTCTFVELVDCEVKKNISVTRYYSTEECCPGYKLDPINNITCIRTSALVELSTEEPLAVPLTVESSTRGLVAKSASSFELASDGLIKSEVTTSGQENNSALMNGPETNFENVTSHGPFGHNNVDTDSGDDEGPIKSVPKPPKAWFDPKPPEVIKQVGKLERGEEASPSTSVTVKARSGYSNNVSHSSWKEDADSSAGQAVGDDGDALLFGLSYGAYAGIICTLLFITCVVILIMLRVRKRSRKNAAKAKQSNVCEIEITQKMLNLPA